MKRTVCFKAPPELVKKMLIIAREKWEPLSEVVRQAIREYVERECKHIDCGDTIEYKRVKLES